MLLYVKLSERAFAPEKMSKHAAGFDLKSPTDCVVKAHDKLLVKLNLQIKVPAHTYGRIASRSGLALNYFIHVGAGVVDRDYTGDVGVLLFNLSDTDFEIKRGDRIAQLICERISCPKIKQVDKIKETKRGKKGFGSTGL